MSGSEHFSRFSDFYPFYLNEHRNPICRGLHYLGTSVAVSVLIYAVVTGTWWLILPGIVAGYLFAWVGHFFFEHNRPATFQHPLYSFMGDWVMLKDFLTGRLRERMQSLPDARPKAS